MLSYSSSRLFASLVLALATLSVMPPAHAACGCPSDGNSAPKAATGLGQEFPSAVVAIVGEAEEEMPGVVLDFSGEGVGFVIK